MNRRALPIPVLIVLVQFTAVNRASAYPVTFEFAGEVRSLWDRDNSFGGAISVGDAFSGTYTFESTTPDTVDRPTNGLYMDAIIDISGQINGIDFVGPVDTSPDYAANLIGVVLGTGHGAGSYGLGAGVELLDHRIRFELHFRLGPPGALQDDSLPLEPPPIDFLGSFGMRFVSEIPGAVLTLSGDVHSLALVPEPASLVLLTVGTAVLLRRRRR